MRADYVVVGAGSAGCVVASRLSETGASVILLEAGPSDWHPMIHIPAGMRSLIRNPVVNWNFTTEPEKGTGERRMEWPRGRVMGGSSSINGMLYVRGFDEAVGERQDGAVVLDLERAALAAHLGIAALHVVLGFPEVGQHVVVAPAFVAELAPVVVVDRMAPRIHHAVHGR